jgi:N-acetylmuramoyl-L-alanine amidase
MKKIILIAGHHRAGIWPPHRKDPGAVCPYEATNEHYEAEKIVYDAGEWLKRNGATDVVVCDFLLDLLGKIKWLNKNFTKDCVVLEVHFNSAATPQATGVETWYLSGDTADMLAATVAQKILVDTLGLRDRGVKGDLTNRWGRLGILRDTVQRGSELLIEIGFISNRNDLAVARERGALAIGKVALALA